MKTLNYKPIEVAGWFTNIIDRESGDSITHLKVQKLVYYSEAWSLALYDCSLFNDDIEAWAHGPVVPSLYHHLKSNGSSSLDVIEVDICFDDQSLFVLNEVQRVYGEISAKRLEYLTHQEQPWLEARGDLAPEAKCTNLILRESMKAYYEGQLQ